MAKTYQWSDFITLARTKFAKGVPADSAMQAQLCDMVSSRMWSYRPWFDAQTTIAAGAIPLVDAQQDYASVPANFYRPLAFSLVRTDTSPYQHLEIGVKGTLTIDMVKRSPYAIRSASYEPAYGVMRLESAPVVASGTTWELRGVYQRLHSKVTSTSSLAWFDDQYQQVALDGLLYFLYKLADDPRAGTATKQEDGKAVYSGQLADFMDGLDNMAKNEDLGSVDAIFPDVAMGAGRDTVSGFNIFP